MYRICRKLPGCGLLTATLVVLGCSDESAPTLPTATPNQPPVANFSINVTEGAAPLEVRFDASASSDPDGTIASYAWEFGDGQTGSGRSITHSYATVGSYTPVLTVTDDRGATHSRNGSPITVNSPPGSGEQQISGTIWHDANADGVHNEDEDGIPAMIVFLDENGDGIRDSTEVAVVTDDDGSYLFEGLDADRSYTVTQQLTIGWTNTAPGLAAPGTAAIIGGSEAIPHEFPFQVALISTDGRRQFCGGTFIAAEWALTAAHCVDGVADPAGISVLAGAHNKHTDGDVIGVERIYIHPAYSTQAPLSNDVALLRLSGRHMYPRIELMTPEQSDLAAPGTESTAIGWGLTSEGGESSDVLKKLNSVIISNDECRTHLGDNIVAATICAGKLGASESICNGDSGGPLMVPFRQRWLQVGIVSFGTQICYQPTAYARVSTSVDYVRGIVPPERSGSFVVAWNSGEKAAVRDFGNFR